MLVWGWSPLSLGASTGTFSLRRWHQILVITFEMTLLMTPKVATVAQSGRQGGHTVSSVLVIQLLTSRGHGACIALPSLQGSTGP